MSGQPVFLRNATGLRREFGVLDTIWINLSLVGIIFSITFVASEAPLVAGDPLEGGLIAFAGMFVVGLAFSIVSIVVPRTAGDYVFTSRYLHPALGFVGNAGYFVATVPLFMGITITTIETFGFSSLFAYWGLAFHNQTYLNWAGLLYQNIGYEFAVGAVTTILFAMLPFFGYRLYRALNKVILPLVILGVIVMFGILAFTSQSTAFARLDALAAPFGNGTFAETINSMSPAPVTNFAGHSRPKRDLRRRIFLHYFCDLCSGRGEASPEKHAAGHSGNSSNNASHVRGSDSAPVSYVRSRLSVQRVSGHVRLWHSCSTAGGVHSVH